MPRYLTPNRICLLLLTEIYLAPDLATAAKLPVLQYISSRIQLPSTDPRLFQGTLGDLSSGDAFAAFSLSLSQYPGNIPGRTLYDSFLNKIWSLNSLDSLHELFTHLATYLAPPAPKLSRSSPLGQFLRRCDVEFTRLQFSNVMELWDSFSSYRLSTFEHWAQRNPSEAAILTRPRASPLDDIPIDKRSIADADNANDSTTAADKKLVSADDTDALITFSIQQLQKLGTRLPHDIKQNLSEWIIDVSDSGVQSRKHFLEFFEYWRAGQYNTALESLHQYFDYSLHSVAAPGKSATDNMRLYYQYALLHLSVLHADFECWEESVDAMDECIATARENQDTSCLNFALSWLLYLRQANANTPGQNFSNVGGLLSGGSGEEDEIAFLKTKAKESRQWSLLSSTLLEEAKLNMYSSGSDPHSLEHIVQSSYLNVQYDLQTLMPASSLFYGAFFERLGQPHVCHQLYRSLDCVFSSACPISDIVRGASRIAYTQAQRGNYTTALDTLRKVSTNTKGILKLNQRLMGFGVLVKLTRELRHGNLRAAEYFLSELRILGDMGDPELLFETEVLEVDFLIQSSRIEEGLRKVDQRVQRLKALPGPDIAQRLHLLVLKSKLFCAAGKPIKGFSISLRAASTAMRMGLVPILTEAVLNLCFALMELGEYAASRDLLEAILPTAIESTNSRTTAQGFATLAESYSGIAGYACAPGSSEQTRNVQIAEGYIERAREEFAKLEDVDGMLNALSIKGIFARSRGDDASASQAHDLSLQLLADRLQTVDGL